MNNPECKYLFDILENTFENAQPGCLKDDCRAELLNAVEGIDQVFTALKVRLDQMEADMGGHETTIEEYDRRIQKRSKEIGDINYRLNDIADELQEIRYRINR